VRQAREAAGYTQAQAAAAAGISHRTITYLEAGNGTRVDTLEKLALVYNVPFSHFIRDLKPSKITA
jgi:transcriptional regulator with XRE-family HTH domain